MTVLLVLLVLMAIPLEAQRVTVPTRDHIGDLTPDERRALESLSSMSVDEAIQDGFLVPGAVVDFDLPGIAFIRDFNIWLNHRAELVKLYGADAFHKDVNDVGDHIKFNNMYDTYQEYCKAVDKAYRVHLDARRQMERLKKQMELKQYDNR